MEHLDEVDALLQQGATKAQQIANEVLGRVRTKLGFL
jgi:tryptophanyl-tRNA synthetase